MNKGAMKLRHERSQHDYPNLKLDDDEYVEMHIRRSRVGLWFIGIGAVAGIILVTVMLMITLSLTSHAVNGREGWPFMIGLGVILYIVVVLFAIATAYVYRNNEIFLTNERIIQLSQEALFVKSTNIIDLHKIEDVSFKQTNPLQYMFSYGTIRLSTVGDETIYTFKFIDTPRDELEMITKLVHEAAEGKK